MKKTMTAQEQIDYMRTLELMYYDWMEGEDLPGFKKWEHLCGCAHDIRVAMEEELPKPI